MRPTDIAKRLNCSINDYKRYLRDLGEYARHLRTLESIKVNSNDRRTLFHEASKHCSLGSQLCSTFNLPLLEQSVQQILLAEDHFSFRSIQNASLHTDRQ